MNICEHKDNFGKEVKGIMYKVCLDCGYTRRIYTR